MEEVSSWCQEYHISSFIETSAKTSSNVYEAFILAVKQWQKLEKCTEKEMRAHGDTIDLTKSVRLQGQTRNCCNIGMGGSRSNSPATFRNSSENRM